MVKVGSHNSELSLPSHSYCFEIQIKSSLNIAIRDEV
jgi:hypothetical protein